MELKEPLAIKISKLLSSQLDISSLFKVLRLSSSMERQQTVWIGKVPNANFFTLVTEITNSCYSGASLRGLVSFSPKFKDQKWITKLYKFKEKLVHTSSQPHAEMEIISFTMQKSALRYLQANRAPKTCI